MLDDILYEAIEKEARAIENDRAANEDAGIHYKDGVCALLRAVKKLLITKGEDY